MKPGTQLGAWILVAAFLASASMVVEAADKKKFKWTHTSRQTVSESKLTPKPDAEYTHSVYVDPVKSASPDFNIVEERIYDQSETIAGDGKHRGVAIDKFKNGDIAINEYEGTHKVVTKGNDDWEVHYEGKFKFIGGTGKFKNLKGGGTYKGHITPKSLKEEDEAEVTY